MAEIRIALGIEYDGSHYRGWQKQPHDSETVQEYLEKALSYVAAHPVSVVCAGRTDTGVHGAGQVPRRRDHLQGLVLLHRAAVLPPGPARLEVVRLLLHGRAVDQGRLRPAARRLAQRARRPRPREERPRLLRRGGPRQSESTRGAAASAQTARRRGATDAARRRDGGSRELCEARAASRSSRSSRAEAGEAEPPRRPESEPTWSRRRRRSRECSSLWPPAPHPLCSGLPLQLSRCSANWGLDSGNLSCNHAAHQSGPA